MKETFDGTIPLSAAVIRDRMMIRLWTLFGLTCLVMFISLLVTMDAGYVIGNGMFVGMASMIYVVLKVLRELRQLSREDDMRRLNKR